MTWYKKSSFLWIISILFTLFIAYYQRTTGPTYPVSGKATINGKVIRFRLLTSCTSDKPAEIMVKGNTLGMVGRIRYKKFNTGEDFQEINMRVENNVLKGELPPQPPAGKLAYSVMVSDGKQELQLNEKPVVIRFKGSVPAYVLIPHVILMFLAMLFSTRTGIEAFLKRDKTGSYTSFTLIFLLIGGMFLGPVVQKYAFGAYWTGWPFGRDLTDNKTLVAFVAWIIAYIRLRKDNSNRGWAVAASLILLLVYLIPHSMFGSELDYSTGEIGTGK
jgi:hypothetical protein